MVLKKKLVRDKVHEIYSHRPMHVAGDKEYELELNKKLQEETEEYRISGKVEELVDIIEVCYAISELKGVSLKELEAMRIDKANKRGKFKKRIIFDEVDTEKPLDFEDQQN
jgi:predicted house-cleaning noncanonical NTP pyrophosphatase (MazG superfamily)